METEKLAAAFNAWMDDYVNDPEAFKSTTAVALQHAKERKDGRELTYGQSASTTLLAYLARLDRRNAPPARTVPAPGS